MPQKRIGIYAGTFDPVHSGHVSFALQAIEAAQLDAVYFLPERRPRAKDQVEHFAHRVAMLRRALKPHAHCSVLEFVDVNFSVERTLPQLQQRFAGDQLVFLFGSDVVPSMGQWPNINQMFRETELVIGLRNQDDRQTIHQYVETWETQPRAVTIFPSFAPRVSSGEVREALRKHQPVHGLLTSVERYSDRHWLYVSLA